MKPSSFARCAITNEYLRRRKQLFCDATNCPRLEHHVALLSVTIEEMSTEELQTEWRLMDSPQPRKFSTGNEECCTETSGVEAVALDKISTATIHRRDCNAGKPISKRYCTESTILVALQLNTNRRASIAPVNTEPSAQDMYLAELIPHKRDTVARASQDMANHEHHNLTAFRFPSSKDGCASKINVPSPHSEELSKTAWPTSDITLFEDAPLCSVSPLGCGKGIHAYAAYDDVIRKEIPVTCATQAKEYETTSAARRYARHCRYVSSDSAFDVAERPSSSMLSRAKTNDGLLLFRANSSKEPTASVHTNRHRHKVSLNLPVNPHASQRDGTQRPRQLDSEDWTQRPAGIESAHPTTELDIWAAEERDLEYKHRHTFIGTGSLDDFLEILEISTKHTTTKSAVARAFVQLASAEQLYARQCSTGKNGWNLVSRTSLTVMDVTGVDYVVQLQVKLGSITLRRFLDLIPFDEVDEIAAIRVIEALSVASHMDMTAGTGTGSKAKAFRGWLVEQMKVDADH